MVPDVGAVGLVLVIIPLFVAFPLLVALITVAVVAKYWGRSLAWGFAGLLASVAAGSIMGWLVVIIHRMGVNIFKDGGVLIDTAFLWAALTWAIGSSAVLIPLWLARKRRQV